MIGFLKSLFGGNESGSVKPSSSSKFEEKSLEELLKIFEFSERDIQSIKDQLAGLSDNALKLTRAAIANAAEERSKELAELEKELSLLQDGSNPGDKTGRKRVLSRITTSKNSWKDLCLKRIKRRVSTFEDIYKQIDESNQRRDKEYNELQTRFLKERLKQGNFVLKPKVKCPHCENTGMVYMGEKVKSFSTVAGSGKFLGVLKQEAQNTSTKVKGMACLNCEVEWDI